MLARRILTGILALLVGACEAEQGPDPRVVWSYETDAPVSAAPRRSDALGLLVATTRDVWTVGPDGLPGWGLFAEFRLSYEYFYLTEYRTIVSPPAVVPDGGFVFGDSNGMLASIDDEGLPRWVVGLGRGIEGAPLVGPDGTTYVGSDHLFAVAPDGTVRWWVETGYPVVASPALGTDGTLYVPSNGLYAVAPDGTVRWRFATDTWLREDVVVAPDGTILAGSWDRVLRAVHTDGTRRWSFEAGGPIVAAVAVATDGTIFVASLDGLLTALDADGKERWRFDAGAPLEAAPALGPDGRVYVAATDGTVSALDADGTLRWTVDVGEPVRVAPLPADGRLYVASERHLVALTTEDVE